MADFRVGMRYAVRTTNELGEIIIFDMTGDQESFRLSKYESELLRDWLKQAEDHLSEED